MNKEAIWEKTGDRGRDAWLLVGERKTTNISLKAFTAADLNQNSREKKGFHNAGKSCELI